MKGSAGCKKGITFTEVLVSSVIVVIIVLGAELNLSMSSFFCHNAKHKTQAMYAAQQLLEQERRKTFTITSSVTSAPVTLDTHGNYDSSAGYFCGTSTTIVKNIDAFRNHVTVQISWLEHAPGGIRP